MCGNSSPLLHFGLHFGLHPVDSALADEVVGKGLGSGGPLQEKWGRDGQQQRKFIYQILWPSKNH